jgi:hypothetical protein
MPSLSMHTRNCVVGRHHDCVVVAMPGTSLVAFTAAGGQCDVGDDYGINTGPRLHQQRTQMARAGHRARRLGRTGNLPIKHHRVATFTGIRPAVVGPTWVVARNRRLSALG